MDRDESGEAPFVEEDDEPKEAWCVTKGEDKGKEGKEGKEDEGKWDDKDKDNDKGDGAIEGAVWERDNDWFDNETEGMNE